MAAVKNVNPQPSTSSNASANSSPRKINPGNRLEPGTRRSCIRASSQPLSAKDNQTFDHNVSNTIALPSGVPMGLFTVRTNAPGSSMPYSSLP